MSKKIGFNEAFIFQFWYFFNKKIWQRRRLEKWLRLCGRCAAAKIPCGRSHLMTTWSSLAESQNLEPILRLLNLQLQRQRCCRLDRFYIREK
jgi:hypothetical protein